MTLERLPRRLLAAGEVPLHHSDACGFQGLRFADSTRTVDSDRRDTGKGAFRDHQRQRSDRAGVCDRPGSDLHGQVAARDERGFDPRHERRRVEPRRHDQLLSGGVGEERFLVDGMVADERHPAFGGPSARIHRDRRGDAPLYVGVIHGNVEHSPEVSLVHEMLPHHTFEVGVEEFEQHALRPRQPQAMQGSTGGAYPSTVSTVSGPRTIR